MNIGSIMFALAYERHGNLLLAVEVSMTLGELGKIFAELRDRSIASSRVSMRDAGSSPVAVRWRRLGMASNRELAEAIADDTVDSVIGELMRFVDDGEFVISFRRPDGSLEQIAAEDIGELCGWYMGEWRVKYSRFPAFDYTSGSSPPSGNK